MKSLALRTLLTLGVIAAALAAALIVAVPVIYWTSEGFTRF